jgi:hypothetical protein
VKIAEIQFPEDLITALRDGTLVVFAGAGVSMGSPANLPDFKRLTELIAAETGERIRDTELEDRFLGRLHLNGVEVHTRAAEILSRAIPTPTELHRNLLRLYGEPHKVRIVTTNFDLLFETAAPEILKVPPDQFLAPALPLGHNFSGIVHVHGALGRPRDMVLTDADFGRGYLTEGWARRFLVDLFRHFTVLFVGYRHNDTIVNYLTRALPESEAGKRFVLTGAGDDPHKWRVLGIAPIGYPKSRDGDYSGLYEGIRRLADTVNRTILDWQRDIIELAKKLPPVGEEEEDIIEHALKEAATTRFFTSAARSPEWISWIDKRKHLDTLFGDTEVQEQHALLAVWLAENYVPRHSEELFLLLSRHGTHLSPLLWWTLERSVFLGPTAVTDPDLLSRWVSLLLTAIPENLNQQVLQHGLRSMGHRCREEGLTAGLLHIFNFMTSSRLILKKPFVSSLGREGSPKRQVEVAAVLVGDDYWLNELWNTALKPNLEHFGADLLKIIICRLEERHSIWVAWQKAKRDFDLDSWRRSAIESGEQDVRRVEIDVLVDATRDCLDHMISDPATMPYINLQCDQLSSPLYS